MTWASPSDRGRWGPAKLAYGGIPGVRRPGSPLWAVALDGPDPVHPDIAVIPGSQLIVYPILWCSSLGVVLDETIGLIDRSRLGG